MKKALLLSIVALIFSSFIAEAMPTTINIKIEQAQKDEQLGRSRKSRKQHNKKPFSKFREIAFNLNIGRYNGRVRTKYENELKRIQRQNRMHSHKTHTRKVKKVQQQDNE